MPSTVNAQTDQAASLVKHVQFIQANFMDRGVAMSTLVGEITNLEAQAPNVDGTIFESTNYFTREFYTDILNAIEDGKSDRPGHSNFLWNTCSACSEYSVCEYR